MNVVGGRTFSSFGMQPTGTSSSFSYRDRVLGGIGSFFSASKGVFNFALGVQDLRYARSMLASVLAFARDLAR